jgi:hypothetical protein
MVPLPRSALNLESPKSHTLTCKLASIRILWLFMSRCVIPMLCMNANARAESLIIRSLSSGVSVNLKCKVIPDLLSFAQVQHVVQRTLCYVFKDYHDVLSIRHDSHQKHNVWMPQNTLHHHLILNLL